MDLMHSQISRAISSAISERINREIQNMEQNLSLSQHGDEPCRSTNEDGIRNVWKNANTKLTKKDSRSACYLRDHTDIVPYRMQFSVWDRYNCIIEKTLVLLPVNKLKLPTMIKNLLMMDTF